MNIEQTIERAKGVIFLKEDIMKKIAKDPESIRPAFIIIALGSVFVALGSYFFPTLGFYQPELIDVVISAVSSFVGILIFSYLIGFFVSRVFKGKIKTQQYVNIIAYAYVLDVFSLYPPAASIAGIWLLVIMGVIWYKIAKLSATQVGLLVLLFIGIFVAIGALMTMVYMASS